MTDEKTTTKNPTKTTGRKKRTWTRTTLLRELRRYLDETGFDLQATVEELDDVTARRSSLRAFRFPKTTLLVGWRLWRPSFKFAPGPWASPDPWWKWALQIGPICVIRWDRTRHPKETR